jgi:hypothetical protein
MGVLYEHWRPDLNECFYVGISWAHEDARPWEMNDRGDDHILVQNELNEKGLCPEIRLVECEHLTRRELGAFEILQIAYWRDLIGDRLVNKTLGGEGIHIDWTDERRQEHSELMQQYGEHISTKKIEWWSVDENKEKTRKSLLDFFQTDYGKKLVQIRAEKQSKNRTAFFQTDAGKALAKANGLKVKEDRNSPEWRERNPDFEAKISSTLKEFAKTAEGKESYENRKPNLSAGVVRYYKTEKGRSQAFYQAWWNSNARFQNYWGT